MRIPQQCACNVEGSCERELRRLRWIVVMPPAGTTVPNYLVFAILTTVLCCLPTGIAAIIYAAQVNGKLLAGDYAGAQAASNNAKIWCWVSFGVGLFGTLFWILIFGAGMLRHLR